MVRVAAQNGFFRKLVANSNRRLVAKARRSNLVNMLASEIELIDDLVDTAVGLKLLDVGCGDMGISEGLADHLPAAEFTCVDTYLPPPEQTGVARWSKYLQFDGETLPFSDSRFDISICIDVLHHAGFDKAVRLLREMGRTSRYILVKDHFERGLVTRTLLQLSDFYGNWGYGVNIPRRYFREQTWNDVVGKSGLKEIRRVNRVQVHGRLVSSVLSPTLHFISVLTSDPKTKRA